VIGRASLVRARCHSLYAEDQKILNLRSRRRIGALVSHVLTAGIPRATGLLMTLKIARRSDGQRTVLLLSGRIQSRSVDEVRKQMDGAVKDLAFDLTEVTLVDLDAVRFLAASERAGVQLLNCSHYIRGWISRERNELENE
jgi:hypothetical protein